MQIRSLLTGLLAAQMVLAGALFFYHQSQRGGQPPAPLLDFAVTDIDRIVISGSDDTSTLVREGEAWQLPELAQLPANAARVDTLLDNLARLETRWPVASSAPGRERFEVSEEKFQRHLALYHGETLLGEYYFGTSPGLRQTHIRRGGDDDVYALTFNSADLASDDNAWLKADLLSSTDITAIKGADFELARQDDSWQLLPPPNATETVLDAAKAEAMAAALQNLRVLRVAESVPAGETRSLTVVSKDGSKDYLFTKAASQYFVKRSDLAQSFTINASEYNKLAGATRASLLQPPPALPAAEAQDVSSAPDDSGANPTNSHISATSP